MDTVFYLTRKGFATIRASIFVTPRALCNIAVLAWKAGQYLKMAKQNKRGHNNKQKTTKYEAVQPQVDNTSTSRDRRSQTSADLGNPDCGSPVKTTHNSVWVAKGTATTIQSGSTHSTNPSLDSNNTAPDSNPPPATKADNGSSTKTLTLIADSSLVNSPSWTTKAATPATSTPPFKQKNKESHKENDSSAKEVTPMKSSSSPCEARMPLEEVVASNVPTPTTTTKMTPSPLRTTSELVKPKLQGDEPMPAHAAPPAQPATHDEARKPLEELVPSNVPARSQLPKVPASPLGATPEQRVEQYLAAAKPKPAKEAPQAQLFGPEDAYEKVFHISKVPLHWTESDLFIAFSTWHTKIVSVRILYNQSTGMSKGSGFVTFINSKEALNAANQIIRGEWPFGFLNMPEDGLRVSFALPETRAAPYKVWVGNLRCFVRRKELREHFATCEGFHDAQVLSDFNVGSPAFSVPRGHGFMRKAGYFNHGFAYFRTLEAARHAVKTMNNSVLLDQAIRVEWPRSKQMDPGFRKAIPELRDQPIPLRQPTPLWMPPMHDQEAPMPAPFMPPAPVPAPVMQPAPTPGPFMQPAPMPVPFVQPAPLPAPTYGPAAPMPEPFIQPAPVLPQDMPSQELLGCHSSAVPVHFGTMPPMHGLPPPQLLFPRADNLPFSGPEAPFVPVPPIAPIPGAFCTMQVNHPMPPQPPVPPQEPAHIEPAPNTSNGEGQPRIINRVAPNERTNVYLGNISPHITKQDVRAMLEAFGPVKQLQVYIDRRFGFAHFYDHQAAAAAVLLLNKRPVGGQTLRVAWSGRQGY